MRPTVERTSALMISIPPTPPAVPDLQAAEVDLSVAAIGLVGVIVGGLLQILFQMRRDRAASRERTRELVVEAHHLGLNLIGSLNQLVETCADRFRGKSEMERKTATEASDIVGFAQEVFDDATKAFAGISSCFGISDHKTAMQANLIRNKLADLNTDYVSAINDHSLDDSKFAKFTSESNSAQFELNVLLTMVEPRWYERRPAFRSRRRAVRLTEQARQKYEGSRDEGSRDERPEESWAHVGGLFKAALAALRTKLRPRRS